MNSFEQMFKVGCDAINQKFANGNSSPISDEMANVAAKAMREFHFAESLLSLIHI